VGKFTNYDRLVLEVWTDGTVSPELALVEAAKIYRKHLNPFVLFQDSRDEKPVLETPAVSEFNPQNQQDTRIAEVMSLPISELELSVRARNCLDGANIKTIGDLVTLPEAEVMNLKNLGKTSITEIKNQLTERGLALGMAAE
jgi:DNA-directed RNA polymerase subunit alpha